jgi:predicted DNA repair protein MutK
MKALSVIGTAAMFMVGGGIIGHAFAPLHHLAESGAAHMAGVPGVGRLLAAVAPGVIDAVAGVLVGAAVLLVVTLVQRLRGKSH